MSSRAAPDLPEGAAQPVPLPPGPSPAPVPPPGRRAPQVGFALAALGLFVLTLYVIRGVIGAFILGSLLAFLLAPAVRRLERRGVPRLPAVLLALAAVLIVLATLVWLSAPLVTEQAMELRRAAPVLAAAAERQLVLLQGRQLNILGSPVDLSALASNLSTHLNAFLLGQFGNVLSLGIAALGTVLQILLLLLVAVLVSLESTRILAVTRRLVPTAYRNDFDTVWSEVRSMLYAYLRGQLVIAALIGALSGIAVWGLGIKFPLALGLIAGITALVPYLGPFLGAAPAVLFALASGPRQALLVALAYLVISNVVLNLVYPKVVGDAVRLTPLLVVVAFIAGYSLGGILGMFVAVPVAALIRILFDHLHPRIFGTAQ